jgi:ATP-binding cassette subfamily F protein uup
MNYLSVSNLAKSFNEKVLFEDLTFGIQQGEKIALVGKNGCGKSTLFTILSGRVLPDKGDVAINKEIKIGLLEQNPVVADNKTVLEWIFEGSNDIVKAIQAYEDALHSEDASLMETAFAEMDRLQAWDYEQKCKSILSELGIDDFKQSTNSMSGGEKRRMALAKVLITEPDLLLLDEPTNHLDLTMIAWLENYLSKKDTTLLLITHDRYFLDAVCNTIIEINNGKLFKHQGNYHSYLENKEERMRQFDVMTGKAQNLYKKELEWMRRQPKARGTKAKYREDAFVDVEKRAKETQDKSKIEWQVKGQRQGNKVVEATNLSKAFGDKKIFENFTHIFTRKEKLGIVGPNGSGKSTFIKILCGELSSDTGKLDYGDTTKIGWLKQEDISYPENERVIDIVKNVTEYIEVGKKQLSVTVFLQSFGFNGAEQYTPFYKLSGGEKKRLQLIMTLLSNPNFLILDEPTNDLDLDTINSLADFLEGFEGSLLLISHDRYLMDLAVDQLFVFGQENQVKQFNGNYTDYQEFLKSNKILPSNPMPIEEKVEVAVSAEPLKAKQKLSFKEKKELETLTLQLDELEKEKLDLVEKLNEGGNYEAIQKISDRLLVITNTLDEATLRWLELSEKE